MPRTGSQRTGIFAMIAARAWPASLDFGSIERVLASKIRGELRKESEREENEQNRERDPKDEPGRCAACGGHRA